MDQNNEEADGRRSAETPERKEYHPPTISRIDAGRRTATGSLQSFTEEEWGASYCVS